MLVALVSWVAITVGWWSLALWPMEGSSADWLLRARAVCFNTTDTGLPDGSGWLLLVGQPMGMLAVLAVGWPAAFRGTFGGLTARPMGRAGTGLVGITLLAGLIASGVRVTNALASTRIEIAADELHPLVQERADIAAAPLDLVNHEGDRVTLAQFRGRSVLLTFAFGHCETVCPAVVASAEQVRTEIPGTDRPVLLVVTLDPWRDTPGRLATMARAWGLSEDAWVLGGSVEDVNRALDDWHVWRTRDERTGDIVHAPLVYVLDAEGDVAFTSRGGPDALRQLLGRLNAAG
jgi:protein SCO1/2